MSTNVTIAKRKRVSKKTKKSWRKNCDINDVENFLQDQRVQEATGGLAVNKRDDQLFFVDKKVSGTDDTKAGKRRQPKQLRCHAALIPDPMIPPARTCHNERREKTKTDSSKKQQSESSALKRKAPPTQSHNSTVRSSERSTYDLWGNTKPSGDEDEHFITVCKKKRVKPPSYYTSKPSELPAVEVPVPGASYRPTNTDHKELLRQAVDTEKKKIKMEQRLKRALDDKFPIAGEAPNENSWLEEWQTSGLFDEEPETVEQTVNNDDECVKLSNNPPVRRENKKTEKERRRLKEAKKMAREAKEQKQQRIRAQSTLRLKSLKKEVMTREMALAARRTRRQFEEEQTKGIKTRRLGRVKYEEPDLELKLSDELPTALRLLKPEGNLLVDRIKSLQKRNMIEPRQRAKVVYKYKPKAFEKKSHKFSDHGQFLPSRRTV